MSSLSKTKTLDNLKAAFAGESQANRRYLYFAQKADVEGYNDVAAVFRSTAFRACAQFRRAEPSQSATAADTANQAARTIGIHHQSMSTSL